MAFLSTTRDPHASGHRGDAAEQIFDALVPLVLGALGILAALLTLPALVVLGLVLLSRQRGLPTWAFWSAATLCSGVLALLLVGQHWAPLEELEALLPRLPVLLVPEQRASFLWPWLHWVGPLTGVAFPAAVLLEWLGVSERLLTPLPPAPRGKAAATTPLQAIPPRNQAFTEVGQLVNDPLPPRRWILERILGAGIVSLLSAPPGLGKGWWLMALQHAMQDRTLGQPTSFYNFQPNPARTLWCTEEGKETFREMASTFEIGTGQLTVLWREQLEYDPDASQELWEQFLLMLRFQAARRHCTLIILDTVRAWVPSAETSPSQANARIGAIRRILLEAGYAVVLVHHARKGGGENGEGVAGTNGLVGAIDILIELDRVDGMPNARRMKISRRFGEQDLIGVLKEQHYLLPTAKEAEPPTIEETLPRRLRSTYKLLTEVGEDGVLLEDVQRTLKIGHSTAFKYLTALQQLNLARTTGGVKGRPAHWYLVPPAESAPSAATASSPESNDDEASEPVSALYRPVPPRTVESYQEYLRSAHWRTTRARILKRADGLCEDCGKNAATQVHHLNYDHLWAERDEDLVAVCHECHRLRHPEWEKRNGSV